VVHRSPALWIQIGVAGESTMNTLLVLLALWIGTMAGFFVFALMAMARDSERDHSHVFARTMRKAARARARGAVT
jgi:hypothetical protein